MTNRVDWFEQAFDELYPVLYPHRDQTEARSLLATLVSHKLLYAADRVLDAGCGQGRWLEICEVEQLFATGFDLSSSQLSFARRHSVVRADLRYAPYRDQSFDVVVSLFSSFGYFESEQEDEGQLRELHRVLVAGGRLVLDTAPATTLERLVSHNELKLADGRCVQITRKRYGNRICKRIEVDGFAPREEWLRIYSAQALDQMTDQIGLTKLQRWGDYAGEAFDEATAERMITVYVRDH